MASKEKLEKLMAERSPLIRRKSLVSTVNIDATPKPIKTERTNGTTERSDRTVTENTSLLQEMEQGVQDDKRPTERYSFEIYTDQKEKIEDLQYQYKKKTGNKLSASRILREALEAYLAEANKKLQ